MLNQEYMILTKYLALSGVLCLIFMLLLKSRISYLLQRIVLLSILPVSLLAATLSFDVFGVEEDLFLGSVIAEVESVYIPVSESTEEDTGNYGNSIEATVNPEPMASPILYSVDWREVIWGCIALVLLLRLISSVCYILRLRSLSDVEPGKGYSICRCGLVDSPFSFL